MKTNISVALLFAGAMTLQACGSNENKATGVDSSITDTNVVDHSAYVTTDTLAADPGKDPAKFAEQAAIGGMMEVEAGKIAHEKTKNQQVKDFASMMIKDHTAAATELDAIAKRKQMSLPTMLPSTEQAHLDEMKKMSGDDFDKHYMDMMVNDHKKTVDLFKSATENTDAELGAFAKKTLKVIEGHHKLAQDINGVLKAK
ncbi:putative outer membrane protein [Pedobacter sp. BAL39]|uniref:DUF4142 domain-containing protein n=1 Tax=Pedobacter sp. BAL39 TaxID=391596 RepID=UPI000155AC47|nr:DUF4142 domain-containing protein [Pedobacter sp. BAL39]EDM34712.1 putative outer membrane protein [Pedobacter sp. BAL39]